MLIVRKNWVKEIRRDILALGSPVFYFLVIGRALVGPFWDLFNPLIFLAPVLFTVSKTSRDTELYLARALLMAAVITHHYDDVIFGLFSAVIIILMTLSARKLGRSQKQIRNGLILGAILAGAGLIVAALSA